MITRDVPSGRHPIGPPGPHGRLTPSELGNEKIDFKGPGEIFSTVHRPSHGGSFGRHEVVRGVRGCSLLSLCSDCQKYLHLPVEFRIFCAEVNMRVMST